MGVTIQTLPLDHQWTGKKDESITGEAPVIPPAGVGYPMGALLTRLERGSLNS